MCGIAGYLRTDGAPIDAAVLRDMADRLRHRGPDGDGYHMDGPVGLAHRRLAIIDLEGGVQPLANEDGTVWVTFNGEIYNFQGLMKQLQDAGHVFRTRSDTEVLVHAYEEWGSACVEHLRGMFAFAIWDAPRRRLFLARDRVGIKPLYVLRQPGLVAFASEMQAFQALPEYRPTLDLQALDQYLHWQYIPAPLSIYREVRKLEPAHAIVFDHAGRTEGPRRYWQLEFRPDRRPSEAEWVERLDAELRETVRLHLVSDVPFGAFLSGGVDSSTVVAYMSQILEQPVRTFSIGFEEEEFNECRYAREVAKRFGTEHHEENVRPDHLSILPELVRHYGEPFADSSAVPTYYVSRLAGRHVKMVLSGDGGDENFAGYWSYAQMHTVHPGPQGLYRKLRFALGSGARALGLRPPLPSPRSTWYKMVSYFDADARARLWRPEYRHLIAGTGAWFDKQMERAPREMTSQFQHFDIHNYLPHDILTKVDVASMCHSLEVRVPLLDHVLMELAAQVPPELKLARSAAARPGHVPDGNDPTLVGKYLLKKTGEQFFPGDFLHRSKRGFEVPIRHWFAAELKGELAEQLLDRSGGLGEFFETETLRGLLDEPRIDGKQAGRLWSLLFLTHWLRMNKVPEGRPHAAAV